VEKLAWLVPVLPLVAWAVLLLLAALIGAIVLARRD
jgi:NADH:ubiquinone oxidoreductase subunit 6 (subunit J)